MKKRNRLVEVTKMIEVDIESSKRHWREVLVQAEIRLESGFNTRPRMIEFDRAELTKAQNALALLDQGIRVDIWTGKPVQ